MMNKALYLLTFGLQLFALSASADREFAGAYRGKTLGAHSSRADLILISGDAWHRAYLGLVFTESPKSLRIYQVDKLTDETAIPNSFAMTARSTCGDGQLGVCSSDPAQVLSFSLINGSWKPELVSAQEGRSPIKAAEFEAAGSSDLGWNEFTPGVYETSGRIIEITRMDSGEQVLKFDEALNGTFALRKNFFGVSLAKALPITGEGTFVNPYANRLFVFMTKHNHPYVFVLRTDAGSVNQVIELRQR